METFVTHKEITASFKEGLMAALKDNYVVIETNVQDEPLISSKVD